MQLFPRRIGIRIESAAICNAFGLDAPEAGLAFPPGSIEDLPNLMRPVAEGGVLPRRGMVEVISCLRPDGAMIPYDIRNGALPKPASCSASVHWKGATLMPG